MIERMTIFFINFDGYLPMPFGLNDNHQPQQMSNEREPKSDERKTCNNQHCVSTDFGNTSIRKKANTVYQIKSLEQRLFS